MLVRLPRYPFRCHVTRAVFPVTFCSRGVPVTFCSRGVHQAATAGYDGDAVEKGGSKADLYDQRRPGYDRAVIEELARQLRLAQARVTSSHGKLDGPAAVIELGAGTGKFSQSLAEKILSDHDDLFFVASEPVEGMREVLKSKLPTSPRTIVAPGSSNDLQAAQEACARAVAESRSQPEAPVPPVCGVTAAQAFHWFANDATLAEMSRIVAPGGILALVWNNRDTSLKWVRDLEEVVSPLYPKDVPRQQYGEFMLPFIGEAPGAKDFAPMGVFCSSTQQRGDVEMVVGRVLSLSVVANRPKAEQDVIADKCRAVVHANLANVDDITLPYLTHAFFFMKRVAPVSAQQARIAYREEEQWKLLGQDPATGQQAGWRPIPYAGSRQSPEGFIWHALGLER